VEARAPVLAAVDVRKRFGALAVLDGVHLAMNQGEAVGIVGPNGAGKTTLLRLCMGLAAPTRGRISWGAPRPRRRAARSCFSGR